jgi:hypothetical protein
MEVKDNNKLLSLTVYMYIIKETKTFIFIYTCMF